MLNTNTLTTRVTRHYPAGVTVCWLVSLLMIQPLVRSLVIQFVLSRRGPFIHGSLVSAQSQMWVRRSVICRQSDLFFLTKDTGIDSRRLHLLIAFFKYTLPRESTVFVFHKYCQQTPFTSHPIAWHNFRLRPVTYIFTEISFIFGGKSMSKMSISILIKKNKYSYENN